MNEFERLLHSGSPRQRAMLAAAKDDAPSSTAQQRVLSALGLGSAVVAGGNTAQAASDIGNAVTSTGAPSLVAPAMTSLAAPTASLTAAVLVKWALATTLTVSIGIAGSWVGRRIAGDSTLFESGPSASSSRPQTTKGAPERAASEGQGNPLSEAPVPAARAEATLPLPPPQKDSAPHEGRALATSNPAYCPVNSAVSSQPARLTVREEIALVERARDALRRNRPRDCLSFLETRRKGVHGGVLAPEATLLRIEALRALGQREQATTEAVRFSQDYPDSPLLERVRDLLNSSSR